MSGHDSVGVHRHRHDGVITLSRACAFCGNEPRKVLRRDDFTMRTAPFELWWKDELIALSRLEMAVMEVLMIHGRCQYARLEQILDISEDTRVTLIHRIRRKACLAGAPNPIETVRGWGIGLRRTSIGPGRVWIGMNEFNEERALAAANG